MAISFIASNEFNSDTDATTFTITDPLPTGLQTNDVCVLAIACPGTATGSITFSGWTLVREVNDSSSFHRASIWYRVIEGGDATTTDFTFDPPGTPEGIAWISSLYRGVDTTTPFLVEDAAFSDTDADNALLSPTVNNTNADAWAVSAGFGSDTATGDATVTWTASASGWTATERNDIDGGETTAAHYVGLYDSNATITTGDKSVTHTMGSTTTDVDMVSWIGILKPNIVAETADPDTPVGTATANAAAGSVGGSSTNPTGTVTSNAPAAGVAAVTI